MTAPVSTPPVRDGDTAPVTELRRLILGSPKIRKAITISAMTTAPMTTLSTLPAPGTATRPRPSMSELIQSESCLANWSNGLGCAAWYGDLASSSMSQRCAVGASGSTGTPETMPLDTMP